MPVLRLTRKTVIMEDKRFYRSNTNRIIGGVCSGLGDYFDIDPVIMRVIFFILAFAGGGGVLIYILLWILVPDQPVQYTNHYKSKPNTHNSKSMETEDVKFEETRNDNNSQPFNNQQNNNNSNNKTPEKSNGALIAGLMLIVLGFMFLADRFIPAISFGDLWPLILVAIGGILIYENYKEKNPKK